MNKTISFGIVIFVLLATFSCMKKEEFPIEPAISIKELKWTHVPGAIGGTVCLTISFTDGDGDIGLSEKDSLPPYDYNLFVKLFNKKNGVFEEIIFPDTTLNYNARIPMLNANSSNKTLKGDIEYKMDLFSKDTLKLEIFLRDRALHESNIVSSEQFVIK